MGETREFFKQCSICKKPIDFGARYYACTVSTCNRPRTALYFCTPECCDAHAPSLNHRTYAAEEKRAPSREDFEAELRKVNEANERAKERGMEQNDTKQAGGEAPKETLIVASKLKAYIRAASGMNTSDAVIGVLSEQVRAIADQAIAKAKAEGRKTVLERDIGKVGASD